MQFLFTHSILEGQLPRGASYIEDPQQNTQKPRSKDGRPPLIGPGEICMCCFYVILTRFFMFFFSSEWVRVANAAV